MCLGIVTGSHLSVEKEFKIYTSMAFVITVVPCYKTFNLLSVGL